MPIDNEGRIYRRPRQRNPQSSIPKPPSKTVKQASSSSKEMSGLEVLLWLIGCLACLVLIVFVAYGAWLGLAWLYGAIVRLFQIVAEYKEVIIGLILLLALGSIKQ